ncbi:MAG: response regulator [bacterium]|nr:response regulator [bacterium]
MNNIKKFNSKRALLVDDDIDFLEIMSFNLKSFGFEVIIGESQKEGEGYIDNEQYDIAVFDLMMENADSGFILSYQSKKKHPEVPVIIITSVTTQTGLRFDVSTSEVRDWIKADSILDKCIRQEELGAQIEKLLE